MPRDYFHIRNSRDLMQDTEGQDFPSQDEALAEAKQAVRDILSERLKHDQPLKHLLDIDRYKRNESRATSLTRVG